MYGVLIWAHFQLNCLRFAGTIFVWLFCFVFITVDLTWSSVLYTAFILYCLLWNWKRICSAWKKLWCICCGRDVVICIEDYACIWLDQSLIHYAYGWMVQIFSQEPAKFVHLRAQNCEISHCMTRILEPLFHFSSPLQTFRILLYGSLSDLYKSCLWKSWCLYDAHLCCGSFRSWGIRTRFFPFYCRFFRLKCVMFLSLTKWAWQILRTSHILPCVHSDYIPWSTHFGIGGVHVVWKFVHVWFFFPPSFLCNTACFRKS